MSASLASFEGFQLDRVLGTDERGKTCAVLGSFHGKPGQAVILLKRRHFSKEILDGILTGKTSTTIELQNDVYSKYSGEVAPEHGLIDADVIYPATDKHISKYSTQRYTLVRETPQMYREAVLPFITAIPEGRIQWVYNILEKKAEVERLLFDDPDPLTGFMLHPDLKWDRTRIEGLYCIALCHRRDVRSIRDLTTDHLPLLKNILQKGLQVLKETFKVDPSELRVFVHYQPSYYHFHVHFSHLSLESAGTLVGKAHLLDDVIENIELMPDYYSKKTMTYTIGENDPLVKSIASWQAVNTEPPTKKVKLDETANAN